jgi:hypothetical protein
MADKKISELTAITSVSDDDLLLVVNDPLGVPASNKITVTNFFANITSVTTAELKLTDGGIANASVATSNAANEGVDAGTIWYSDTHLYIATDTNTIKRVNLSTF